MSNNKPSGDSPEVQARILAAMNKKLRYLGPKEPTDLDTLMARAKQVNREVAQLWLPIDKAVRDLGHTHDPKTVATTISQFYLDKFCHWSKDDLLMLLVIMHTEQAVQQVV